MRQHYTFHSNIVSVHVSWSDVLKDPRGSFFYTPTDNLLDRWGAIYINEGETWTALPLEKIPKEFLTQLLLMGVPC